MFEVEIHAKLAKSLKKIKLVLVLIIGSCQRSQTKKKDKVNDRVTGKHRDSKRRLFKASTSGDRS
jgi:hypothetical protein